MRRAPPPPTRAGGEGARPQGDTRRGHTLRPPYRVPAGMYRAIPHPLMQLNTLGVKKASR